MFYDLKQISSGLNNFITKVYRDNYVSNNTLPPTWCKHCQPPPSTKHWMVLSCIVYHHSNLVVWTSSVSNNRTLVFVKYNTTTNIYQTQFQFTTGKHYNLLAKWFPLKKGFVSNSRILPSEYVDTTMNVCLVSIHLTLYRLVEDYPNNVHLNKSKNIFLLHVFFTVHTKKKAFIYISQNNWLLSYSNRCPDSAILKQT